MNRRRWLERVEAELAGRGLPAGVRARLMDELRDHLDDLTEGESDMEMVAERRMGDPGALAATAAAEHRRTGWVRRHPLLVFGLAPVPAILLAAVAYMLTLAGVGYAIGDAGGPPPEGALRSLGNALLYGVAFVPFLGVAAGLGWLAVRSGSRNWWAALGLAQVVLLAGLVTVNVTWGDLPGTSQFMLGLGFPLTGWRQALQMLLPLALGWLAIRGRRVQTVAMA